MFTKVRLPNGVNLFPVVNIDEENLHFDDIFGPSPRSAQRPVEIVHGDLKLFDDVCRNRSIRADTHGAGQPHSVTRPHRVAIVANRLRLVLKEVSLNSCHCQSRHHALMITLS